MFKLLSFLLLVSSSFAFSSPISSIMKIEVPEGLHSIELTRSMKVSGCSDRVVMLDVLYSNEYDLYLVGKSLSDKIEIDFRTPLCAAIIKVVEKAVIVETGPKEITIETPNSEFARKMFNVNIQKVEMSLK